MQFAQHFCFAKEAQDRPIYTKGNTIEEEIVQFTFKKQQAKQ